MLVSGAESARLPKWGCRRCGNGSFPWGPRGILYAIGAGAGSPERIPTPGIPGIAAEREVARAAVVLPDGPDYGNPSLPHSVLRQRPSGRPRIDPHGIGSVPRTCPAPIDR